MNFFLSRFAHIKTFYCIIWQFFTIISFKIIHERQLCITSRAMGNFCSIILFIFKRRKNSKSSSDDFNYSSKWLSEFSLMKSGRLLFVIYQRDGMRHYSIVEILTIILPRRPWPILNSKRWLFCWDFILESFPGNCYVAQIIHVIGIRSLQLT